MRVRSTPTAHKCWGDNSEGQLGDGTFVSSTRPVTVSGLSDAVSLRAGSAHTCAALADGTARCWGDDLEGSLGDGTTVDRPLPVPVSGLSTWP